MNLFKNTALFDRLQKIKNLKQGRLFVSVMKEKHVQNLVVDLNVEQMRVDFSNSDGVQLSSIGGNYSPFTVQVGQKKNASSVDLHDTGYFHDSFKVVRVSQTGFFIDSDPFKDDGTNLREVWGEKIEGLTFENLAKLGQYILPLYIEEIKKQIA